MVILAIIIFLLITLIFGISYNYELIFNFFNMTNTAYYNDSIEKINTQKIKKSISEFPDLLDKPLKDFYINSSHNSYIVGTQHAGRSSIDQIIKVLNEGARNIEIDVHEINNEFFIFHGTEDHKSSTTKLKLEDALNAIKNYTDNIDEPILLSIELYIYNNEAFQNIVLKYFEDKLPDKKYLVNGENRVYIDDGPIKDFINKIIIVGSSSSELGNIMAFSKMGNLESDFNNAIKGSEDRIIRIYPKPELRTIFSFNFNPVPFWNDKCNITALNFQGKDLNLINNLSKFSSCNFIPI